MRRSDPHLVVSFQQLESRLFFATQVDFVDFSSTTGLTGNGFGGNPITSGTRLKMTDDGQQHQARSVWFNTAVPITQFRTDFSFRIRNSGGQEADGLTFAVQGVGTAALGVDGHDLGYGTINNSQAVAFDSFDLGNFDSKFGFSSDGATPPVATDMSPIDLHSGHIMKATVRYDGTTLLVFVSDSTNRSLRFTDSVAVDIPTLVGASTATVGFTAATGVFDSRQEILSWSYSGGRAPTITEGASGVPTPGNDKAYDLSVGADNPDSSESDLSYLWTVDRKPSGAPDPVFSPNATNGAKNTTATFGKAGTYRLRVTATNSQGDSRFSRVTINVAQVATVIKVNPHAQTIPLGATQDYNASVADQFNDTLRTQPTIVFSVQAGVGTIDATSGLYTAPNTKGHAVIAATGGDLVGIVGATISG